VGWQATTVALVGILFGVPMGLVVGRVVWEWFASNLGVVPLTVVSAGVVLGIAAAVVLVGVALAVAPAAVAARTRPAVALREE
jgi:ABC-type antimicrobial peptide transport system permease subunit